MKTKMEARELAVELAYKHRNVGRIARMLEDRGFGGLLDEAELESIVREADMVRNMLPHRRRSILPRVIGLLAIIMGLAAIWIGREGPQARGYSPGGYGIVALVLGCILVFKPHSSNSRI